MKPAVGVAATVIYLVFRCCHTLNASAPPRKEADVRRERRNVSVLQSVSLQRRGRDASERQFSSSGRLKLLRGTAASSVVAADVEGIRPRRHHISTEKLNKDWETSPEHSELVAGDALAPDLTHFSAHVRNVDKVQTIDKPWNWASSRHGHGKHSIGRVVQDTHQATLRSTTVSPDQPLPHALLAGEKEKEKDKEKETEEKAKEKAARIEAKKSANEAANKDAEEAREANTRDTASESAKGPEKITGAPFEHMYMEADAVARDLELRRGAEFFPQGTHSQVDMPANEQHRIDSTFNQDPNAFGKCVLIRDFAEPLRVGSAIIEQRTSLRKQGLRGEEANLLGESIRPHHNHKIHTMHKSKKHHNEAESFYHSHLQKEILHSRHNATRDLNAIHKNSFGRLGRGSGHKHIYVEEPNKLPDDVLIPVGGVVDIEAGVIDEHGQRLTEEADLQVSMFAWLRGVAGEVAVIPNGIITKWSSKRTVPLAGYLCPGDAGPVLHTLMTPCLPTALQDDGMPFPPPPRRPKPLEVIVATFQIKDFDVAAMMQNNEAFKRFKDITSGTFLKAIAGMGNKRRARENGEDDKVAKKDKGETEDAEREQSEKDGSQREQSEKDRSKADSDRDKDAEAEAKKKEDGEAKAAKENAEAEAEKEANQVVDEAEQSDKDQNKDSSNDAEEDKEKVDAEKEAVKEAEEANLLQIARGLKKATFIEEVQIDVSTDGKVEAVLIPGKTASSESVDDAADYLRDSEQKLEEHLAKAYGKSERLADYHDGDVGVQDMDVKVEEIDPQTQETDESAPGAPAPAADVAGSPAAAPTSSSAEGEDASAGTTSSSSEGEDASAAPTSSSAEGEDASAASTSNSAQGEDASEAAEQEALAEADAAAASPAAAAALIETAAAHHRRHHHRHSGHHASSHRGHKHRARRHKASAELSQRLRRSYPQLFEDAPSGLNPEASKVTGSYHVWVGNEKLAFSSKPKADRFCTRLATKIARDVGDSSWDSDGLPWDYKPVDPTVSGFMQLSRKKTAKDWTLGTKKVLVVVMDWRVGDLSRAPFSSQKKGPSYYKDTIFPRVRKAFQEMSYGKFDIKVTVVPETIRFLRQRSRYAAQGYPFPGLYNGAKESLQGNAEFGDRYNFDDYDLVYVISPAQKPTSTKGVAWVGAKGAMCNGCEELSENFATMVAVHELGHNLGLWHASSSSLDYGNVYDWMGNYPDVRGLSYGLGYKLQLKWIPNQAVIRIKDRDVASLNDEYYLKPFDLDRAPRMGELVGIVADLTSNTRDLYISYRKSNREAGVYLSWQDKDKPNSELIDCACHSPSQQDAQLQPGWTYLDPSNQIVVYVSSLKDDVATIRIYRAPSKSSEVASIRARPTFTDGRWKCPRTCQDSDLLVSVYDGCSTLAEDGYCKGGAITMGGKKFSIGSQLCPKSCKTCDSVMDGPESSNDGCDDRSIKISGRTCPQAAIAGYCKYDTNMGSVGMDLCPKSCGNCPTKPAVVPASRKDFVNPTPERTHGTSGDDAEEEEMPPDDPKEEEEAAAKEEHEEEEEAEGKRDDNEEDDDAKEKEDKDEYCTDDLVWTDADGDGCDVYHKYITDGKLSREEACSYNNNAAMPYCRKTCNTCEAKGDTCEDKECVTAWKEKFGKCYACADWPTMCDRAGFKADCPRTCGQCEPSSLRNTEQPPVLKKVVVPTVEVTTTTVARPTAPPVCKDSVCVEHWLKDTGKCFSCREFSEEYCGRDEAFEQSCPKSCKTCLEHNEEVPCTDDFKPSVCRRMVSWHWCHTRHVQQHCKASCGLCPSLAAAPAPAEVSDDSVWGGPPLSTPTPEGLPGWGMSKWPLWQLLAILTLVMCCLGACCVGVCHQCNWFIGSGGT